MLKRRMVLTNVLLAILLSISACGEISPEKQAEGLFKNGEYEKAQVLYEELKMDEKAAECAKRIAQGYFDQGEYEKAQEIYEKYGLDNEAKRCVYQIGKALVEQKKYKKALEKLKSIPDYEDVQEIVKTAECGLAMEYFDQGEYEKAQEIYERHGLNDEAKRCVYQIGKGLMEQKKYRKAAKEFKSILDYKDAKSLLKRSEYKNAIVLYKAGKYENAIAQFEKMKDYKNAANYLEKCRMEKKYMHYDYDGLLTLLDDSEGNMAYEEIYQYLESCIDVLYATWYYYDGVEEKSMVIDKFHIDGQEYGLLGYYEDPTMPEYDIYYGGNKDEVYHVSVLYDDTFSDVADDVLLIMTIDVMYRNYDSMAGEYYDHLQQEIWEAAQPAHTKEEVYKIAQQDVKSAIFSQMNIFDQVGLAASVSWDFESPDTIQYDYDPDSNVHSLEFSVYLSEYKGLGERITERLFMQYYEEEDGSLTKTAMYRAE